MYVYYVSRGSSKPITWREALWSWVKSLWMGSGYSTNCCRHVGCKCIYVHRKAHVQLLDPCARRLCINVKPWDYLKSLHTEARCFIGAKIITAVTSLCNCAIESRSIKPWRSSRAFTQLSIRASSICLFVFCLFFRPIWCSCFRLSCTVEWCDLLSCSQVGQEAQRQKGME